VHRRRTPLALTTVAAVVAAALAVLTLTGSPAAATPLCTFQQLTFGPTNTVDIELPSGQAIDAAGDTVAFISSGDYLGTNPDDSNEVWVWDLTAGLQQVTNTTGVDNEDAAINDDGTKVVFSTTANLSALNVDGNREVFRYDRTSGTFANMSTTVGGGDGANNNPDISGDGSVVVYQSDQNPFGQNADANEEIFYRITATTQRVQVTQSTGGFNAVPAIDDDASTIIFRSNRNLDGDNSDLNRELFSYEVPSDVLEQITTSPAASATGVSGNHDLTGNGNVVVFASDADPVGQNADGSTEYFRLTRRSEAVTQLIQSDDNNSGITVDDDGSRTVFLSDEDLDGTNSNENTEVWIRDGATDTSATQTSSLGAVGISTNESGTRTVFRSSASLTGQNSDGGQEVVLASCGSATPTFTDVAANSTFFDEIEWMAAAGISTGFQPGPTYKPANSVTRAAMSAFMFRLAGSPPFADPPTATFSDVATNSTFFTEIEWMNDEGITTGFPGGLYKPNQDVSRQAMSAFMYRLAGSPAFADPPTATFTDVATTSQFFTEIEWMNDEGITTGFPGGLYKPNQDVSRQAMSAFMYRLAGSPAFADPPTATFTDVATTSQFFTEIEWMADEGITTGFQPGPTYKPASAVSRAAMSAFMYRLADGPGVDLS
jgi:hypothetical protein